MLRPLQVVIVLGEFSRLFTMILTKLGAVTSRVRAEHASSRYIQYGEFPEWTYQAPRYEHNYFHMSNHD